MILSANSWLADLSQSSRRYMGLLPFLLLSTTRQPHISSPSSTNSPIKPNSWCHNNHWLNCLVIIEKRYVIHSMFVCLFIGINENKRRKEQEKEWRTVCFVPSVKFSQYRSRESTCMDFRQLRSLPARLAGSSHSGLMPFLNTLNDSIVRPSTSFLTFPSENTSLK